MAAHRELRISSHKDYIAVDMMENGSIIRTPFNISKGASIKARAWDFEEEEWINATISFDGEQLKARSQDGLDWDMEPEDLLDEGQWHFI